jgi:hypothetical protein
MKDCSVTKPMIAALAYGRRRRIFDQQTDYFDRQVFGGQGTSRSAVQGGIRHTRVDKVDFDLIYGRNLTCEEANWLTLGVNLRF